MITRDHISRVLRDIQLRIPKAFIKGVTYEQEATPVIRKVVDLALESPEFDPAKKEQLQTLKEAGYFNKKRVIENPVYAKKINQFVAREINKAIKEGRLPNKAQLRRLQKQWQQEEQNKNS